MRTPFKKILQILDGTPAASSKPRQRGQSFVELALITPILLIMVAGIIEIGWYANNYINLLEAAKVGARRGPFLNGENGPQAFEEKFLTDNNGDGIADSTAIIHPSITYGSVPALLLPTALTDPVLTNTRYSTRGYTFPLETSSCSIIPDNQYGFYNLIACTVLDSLDPLEIRVGLLDPNESPDAPEVYQDDIVISVFSMQKINNGPVGSSNPDGFNDDEDGPGTPYDFDIRPWGYDLGHQVVAVGRWPSEANECFDGTTNLDVRDPFDYMTDGDATTITVATAAGENVILPLELSRPVYNDTGEIIDFEGYNDTNEERQRGWVLTGQRRVTIGDDELFEGNCWGSEFSLERVQRLMNLPRFVPSGDPNYQNRRRYIPSQGMVLVEIFWEHSLLMGDAFPLFYSSYNLLTSIGGAGEPYANDVNVIHVWAAFPAPAAEPKIVYGLD